ncbi:hypothetical protein, partial [Oceanidesulfovibrio marinus]
LKDINAVSGIKRYRGMLPAKLAIFHDAGKVEERVDEECVEHIVITFSCVSELVMLKRTERGHDLIDELLPVYEAAAKEADLVEVCPEFEESQVVEVNRTHTSCLAKTQCILLSDVYHDSKIHSYGALMPSDILETDRPKDSSST